MFLIVFYNYQNHISDTTFWQVVINQEHSEELELVLDTLHTGIIIIDKDNPNYNYFNEFCQDNLSRALTVKQRFSINAIEESHYFNKICQHRIFQEYNAEKTDGEEAQEVLSLEDILA